MQKTSCNIEAAFIESIRVKQDILAAGSHKSLIGIGDAIVSKIISGGKLMICGNGGSAADAQHLAAELLIRLKPKNNRQGIPAISLAQDSSTLTACGNDFGYDLIFSRMVESLGKADDVLLGISTSGNSENVNLAFQAARKMNILTVGFLGSMGGPALELCDLNFLAPSNDTARIQETHITAGHALMEHIEDELAAKEFIQL
tara:strand:- start:40 stop:645 length:606 start_codon:yes stop_codon:yes gene_type:complete